MADSPLPKSAQKEDDPGEGFTKYPMRRLELLVKKFIKVISVDLERLKKHTTNITRLTQFEMWTDLHKEQVNATRTVQQINANILEIEKARRQVCDEDICKFDEQVDPLKTEALEAMAELVAFIGQGPQPASRISQEKEIKDSIEIGTGDIDLESLLSPTRGTAKSSQDSHAMLKSFPSSSSPNATNFDDTVSSSNPLSSDNTQQGPLSLVTTSLHVAPQNSQATASWEELQECIMDLNVLVHEFASRVEEQGESVDAIEDNIDRADQDVAEGVSHLAKASKFKSVVFPVIGAVVGTAVAGPVGLVVGLKIGGLAGMAGGALGFAGGRLYKKRQDKITNIEMSNMTTKRSHSMPEVLNQEAEGQDDTVALTEDMKTQPKSQSLGQVNFGRFFSIFSSPSSAEGEKM